jgi:release factor glutamine methyltransferase
MRFETESANTQPATFRYHDLVIELHPKVYDPAEDSFLLLESLQLDPQDSVLEIGTGCGLIALSCARKGCHVFCTDINPFAVQVTRRNISRNQQLLRGPIDIRQGDLFSAFKNHKRFNVIIFNPPYLPTRKQERTGGWFDIATDGGRDGLKVTKRFLEELSSHLHPNGSAYFVFSSLSNRHTLDHYLKKQKLTASIISRHLTEGEELDVYRVAPKA